MNLFNRIVVILLLLALIPVVTVGLIVPQESIDLLREGLDLLEERLDTSTSTRRLTISGGIALGINVVLILLLYLELRRSRVRAVSVHQVQDGQARIQIDSIVDRLGYRIDRLPGVLEVEPQIVPHRRGVEVVLAVEAVGDANVPETIKEIGSLTRKVVEEELGLKLKGDPKINLRTREYPEHLALGTASESEPVALERGWDSEADAERGDEPESAGLSAS